MSSTPAFASTSQALDMLVAAMAYLAAADATQMPVAAQAQCLQVLEKADAIGTAARASITGAFTASQGYHEDACYSAKSWLIHQTRITRGAAAGHLGWTQRAADHPRVHAALAAGQISASLARVTCDWTGKLPEKDRDKADQILLDAARGGADQRDLNRLGAEMYEKSRAGTPDQDPELAFGDRSVRVETTYGGAGVITGDLTPECTAALTAVLDALSAPAGADDTRSQAQRYHDALEEAMRRLAAAGLLPERAGQPARAWAHISLADLLALDPAAAATREWIDRARARWAAARAAAAVAGGDGAAWLGGQAAAGFACDASVTPVVTGEVNPAALADLVRLCAELARYGPGHGSDSTDSTGRTDGAGGAAGTIPQLPAGLGQEALEQAIIGKAIELVSGPGGLASFLRRRLLGARLGSPSLPLDIGYSDTIPASIRHAVRLRDQHCRWAGGCHQPAAACEVHHVTHKANGGKTSVTECLLLCWYHHQVVIHREGWTLTLNPDGTTTAWNQDRSKVLRSHSPPARAG